MPKQYEALLEAAIRLKEAQLCNLTRDADDVPLSIWEVEAILTFERADRVVQNAKYDDDGDETSDRSKTGKKKSVGFQGKGDSKAFDFTEEQLREMYLERQRRQEAREKRANERIPSRR